MLRRLSRRMFIEEHDEATQEITHFSLANLLSDAHHLNSTLLQRSNSKLGFNLIPEKTAIGVNDDQIKASFPVFRLLQHFIEL
ncbi:hypothetical protein Q4514_01995 [Celeribacter halophilus]|nr:hypothetical protein [Celeribacter halophilus]MDO6509266.1 hypothetical protein [Celeribacter halophilus]